MSDGGDFVALYLLSLSASIAVMAAVGFAAFKRRQARLLAQANAALSGKLDTMVELSDAFDRAAVLLRAPDGTIRHWSSGCERLFGYAAVEAVGHRVHELLATRFPPGGLRSLQQLLLSHGEWKGELRHRHRNGEPVVVAAHWILRCDSVNGQPLSVVEMHADATALKEAEMALRAGEARLLMAQEVAGVGTWEWDPEKDSFLWSQEQYGLPSTPGAPGGIRSFEGFLALVHPEDRDSVRAAARQSLAVGEYEAEFRIARPTAIGSMETRWLIGRGRRMPAPAGRLGPILGVHVDITGRKEAEARQTLLMREVDHRAKNALAVVQAVLRLTRAETPVEFSRAVAGRVAALARAQTLLTESHWAGADLATMLRGELAPFLSDAEGTQVTFDGPPLTILPVAAQPMSMTLHELATNAAKYGSLSVYGGGLALSWSVDLPADRLRLRWVESGGPALTGPPTTDGFGTRVIRATVHDQLGGTATFDWRDTGLVCVITLPLSRSLARDSIPMDRSIAEAVGEDAWRSS